LLKNRDVGVGVLPQFEEVLVRLFGFRPVAPASLTILQGRLASSPEAFYQSLHRRSERLQKRLRELEVLQRGAAAEAMAAATPALDEDDVEDLEEAPDNVSERVQRPAG
jgi:hypothetical protein